MAFQNFNSENLNKYQKITPEQIKEKIFEAKHPQQTIKQPTDIPKPNKQDIMKKNIQNQISINRGKIW